MRLEDFMKNNTDEFNNEEPSKGHFERFEQRLLASKQKKKPNNLRWLVGVAAVMVGLLIGLNFFRTNESPEGVNNHVCILSPEMEETQKYYRSVLDSEVENVEKLLNELEDDGIRKEVMGDVKSLVADTENFNTNFCNSSEEGMATMVEYYQVKIQALENIASIFEN